LTLAKNSACLICLNVITLYIYIDDEYTRCVIYKLRFIIFVIQQSAYFSYLKRMIYLLCIREFRSLSHIDYKMLLISVFFHLSHFILNYLYAFKMYKLQHFIIPIYLYFCNSPMCVYFLFFTSFACIV